MSDARIARLKEFLREDPSDNFTRFALALEYFKKADFGEAEHLFRSILAADPLYVGVYYHLGKLYEATGDVNEAKTVYNKGIAVARKAGELHALSELETALAECSNL